MWTNFTMVIFFIHHNGCNLQIIIQQSIKLWVRINLVTAFITSYIITECLFHCTDYWKKNAAGKNSTDWSTVEVGLSII